MDTDAWVNLVLTYLIREGGRGSFSRTPISYIITTLPANGRVVGPPTSKFSPTLTQAGVPVSSLHSGVADPTADGMGDKFGYENQTIPDSNLSIYF